MTQETVEQFNILTKERESLQMEIKRIDAFVEKQDQNRGGEEDQQKNTNVLVRFSGTACYLPISDLLGYIDTRKNECQTRINTIDTDLSNL